MNNEDENDAQPDLWSVAFENLDRAIDAMREIPRSREMEHALMFIETGEGWMNTAWGKLRDAEEMTA